MTFPKHAALLGAAALVALTGCSSSGAASTPTTSAAQTAGSGSASTANGVQQITVHTNDGLRVEPATVHVHPGTVRVRLVEDGAYPHNLQVTSQKRTSATVDGSPGNGATTLTLRFTTPGRYQFVCTYHAGAGMVGTFVVS